jgi:hypothetical protein
VGVYVIADSGLRLACQGPGNLSVLIALTILQKNARASQPHNHVVPQLNILIELWSDRVPAVFHVLVNMTNEAKDLDTA